MFRSLILSAASASLLIACGEAEEPAPEAASPAVEAAPEVVEENDETLTVPGLSDERRSASAPIFSRSGDVIGEAVISDGTHGMVIRLIAKGLPTGYHGAHLHTVGDCSDFEAGFKAAGGHINLTQEEHGFLNPAGYHVGANFPNIYVPAGQPLQTELFAVDLTLAQVRDQDGFTFIMHENEDDHVTQPIGGAGGRIACAAFN